MTFLHRVSAELFSGCCRAMFSGRYRGHHRGIKHRRASASATVAVESLEVRTLLAGNFGYASVFKKSNSTNNAGVEGVAIDVDASGNTYVTGNFTETVDFGAGAVTSILLRDIFVMKLNPQGDLEWVRTYGSSTDFEMGRAIKFDAGKVFVAGTFGGTIDFDHTAGTATLASAGLLDAFLLRLDSNGAFEAVSRFGGTGDDKPQGIDVAPGGDVFLTGSFNGTVTPGALPPVTSAGLTDIFISRHLRASLAPTSFVKFGSTGIDEGIDVALRPGSTDDIAVAGFFSGTVDFDASSGTLNLASLGSVDAFVLRQRGTTFLWATSAGSTASDSSRAVAMDETGNVYTGGIFQGTTDFDPTSGTSNLTSQGGNDGFVLKQNPAGNLAYVRRLGGSGTDQVQALTVDEDGNVFTAGLFSNAAEFGNSSTTLTATLGVDIFVAKQNTSGNFVFARGMGSSGFDGCNSIATTDEGDIYMTGRYELQADFDPGIGEALRTSAPGIFTQNMFVSHLSPDLVFNDLNSDNLRVKKNGGVIEILNDSLAFSPVVAKTLFSETRSIVVKGGTGTGTILTIDFRAGGSFVLPEGITFDGAAGTIDELKIIGIGTEAFTVQPADPAIRKGTVLAYGQNINYLNMESLQIEKSLGLIIEPKGDTSTLIISPTFSTASGKFSQVSGTTGIISGPLPITPINFVGVSNVTIDTGTKPLNINQAQSLITINENSLLATGLQNLTIRTSRGNDTLTINSPSLALAVPGGAFWYLGGGGVDRLTATADVHWNLNDTRLVSSGGGRIQHDDIEKATLTGGASANNISAVGFLGDATLDGVGGNDLLRGGFGNDTIFGGIGNDRVWAGDGDDSVFGQDGNDQLYGEAGADTLTGAGGLDRLFGGDDDDFLFGGAAIDELRGGNGNDRVVGDAGNDSLFGEAGNDILEGGDNDDLMDGGTGNDSFNGGAGIDLIALEGTHNAEDLQLQRISATSAVFKRKPRGLVSVLEQDTITMDATDEFFINALGGDDLISIDAAITQLGSVDGGDGTDSCTAPVPWTKVSC